MTRYIDGRYLNANPGWHEEDSEFKAIHVARLLQSSGLRPSTICDVGCGTAGVLARLGRETDAELTGWELSPDATRLAWELHPTVKVIEGDLLESDSVYDVVLALDVFEHIDDYMGFLRALRARGEHFVFHIPLDMTAQMVIRASPLMICRQQVGHLHYFSRDTALATLRDCGYSVLSETYTWASVEQPKSLRNRIAAMPRAVGRRLNEHVTVRLLGGASLLVLAH